MATTAGTVFTFKPRGGFSQGAVPTLPGVANSAISQGDVLVSTEATGRLAVNNAATANIVGIAAHDADAAGDTILYWPAYPHMEFEGSFVGSLGTADVTGLDQTDFLSEYALVEADTGAGAIDNADEVGTQVIALRPGLQKDGGSDLAAFTAATNPRVIFCFQGAATIYGA